MTEQACGVRVYDREAVKAQCRDAAWRQPTTTCGYSDCPHDEHAGPPNLLIHCSASGFGADWSLDEVLQTIDEADEIVWVPSIFGHDLCVRVEDRWRAFEVTQPSALGSEASS